MPEGPFPVNRKHLPYGGLIMVIPTLRWLVVVYLVFREKCFGVRVCEKCKNKCDLHIIIQQTTGCIPPLTGLSVSGACRQESVSGACRQERALADENQKFVPLSPRVPKTGQAERLALG